MKRLSTVCVAIVTFEYLSIIFCKNLYCPIIPYAPLKVPKQAYILPILSYPKSR